MMKYIFIKIIIIVIAVLVIIVGGYVLFTLKSGGELNEASPLNQQKSSPVFKDNLDSMSDEEKKEFMKEVELTKDKVIEETESMPSGARLVAQGDFMRRLHGVEGQALLIEDVSGEHVVRFEDFQTDNGPQLYIYLSKDLGDDDFIDLGPIKATKGNINYQVPVGTDIEKYRYVLVWCRPFSVLFSYAELN